MADTHFKIEKSLDDGSTKTTIDRLYDDEAVDELARLLGGAEITDTVRDNAKEMKDLAAGKKKGF
jgi:DNA repair protein RecN (Recombination protein N)